MKRKFTTAALLAVLLAFSITSFSQDSASATKPEKFVTKHSIKIDNKIINYTATAGTIILKNEKDEPVASFGYTAYTKDGETDMTKRPVTFSYNGGPGSSSMWLHMGVMGPRRVVVNDPLGNGPAPYKLEDNNYTILDVSDVVMMDPVGTGLSRAVGKGKNADFWGVDGDIKSVSTFIRNYVHDNERWNSPKFLLGESYGTFRSAGVADYLQETFGISVNGVVLVSNVLDIRTLSFNPGDDLPYIVNLPTYAATSWYHNKIVNKPASLDAFLNEARAFAFGDYAVALQKGDQLSAEERDRTLNKLVAITGLSKDYWDKANLRVIQPQYSQELLRSEGIAVGRLDSRYKGIAQDRLGEYAFIDPQSEDISPAFISAFMNYYTTELKVSKEKTYNTGAYSFPDFKWDWKHQRSQGLFGDAASPNTAPDLVNAMSNNARLKILVLNGIFDLATPFGGTEYTFDHMGLDKKLKGNITMKYYEAGHMMYIHNESAAKFKKDVSDFILGSLK
ncbi:MAG: carboxypeptidase [Sphingobacteriales bacterium]|nr:carboxypeptidase [Sphingobacteriales bacterium]